MSQKMRLMEPPGWAVTERPLSMMSEEMARENREDFRATKRFTFAEQHEIVEIMESLNEPKSNWVKAVQESPLFVEIKDGPGIRIDLLYASENNFTGEVLYEPGARCFLHKEAAVKLHQAVAILAQERTGWSLLVFDALRPRRVQRRMWSFVEGTPQEPYVASPERGSIHNFGYAIDLTLSDQDAREVDMGTPFDDFHPLSQPCLEAQYLAQGLLQKQQVENRELLRHVMFAAGFSGIPNEWWHFEAKSAEVVRREGIIVE